MKPFEPQAKIFKALMHPVRLAILQELRQDEQCVCHLEAKLGLRQAYISQQLMALRQAGLVEDRRAGLNIYYRVAASSVFAILDTAQDLTGSAASQTTTNHLEVHPDTACPCPKCNQDNGGAAC